MAFLTDILGPIGPFILVGLLGLALIAAVIPMMLKERNDPLNKLKDAGERSATIKPGAKLRTAKSNDKLQKYSSFLEPQDAEEYSAARMKLMQAGYRSKDAVRFFHFAQFALGLGLLVAGVLYFMLFVSGGQEVTTQQTLFYVLGPGCLGYMAPKYWVNKRQAKRQEQITAGFPDALDMLLVCVEAGQSLEQSIVRMAKEIRPAFPDLADEFEIVSLQIKAGMEKSGVLRDMAERCGVADVSSFVTVMIQSAAFGTSIAEALRVYSSEMRDKRVMRAEEAANKLPTKMTLVTMMLTVPPLLIILVGPSAVSISNFGN